MKIAHKIGIAAAAGALTIGGAASVFAAGNGSSSTTTGTGSGAATQFVCAHLVQVQAQEQLKEQLLAGRLTLLQEARDAANAAGKTKVVARIDKRITANQERTTKLKDRETKLATACATTPTPTPAG